MIFQGFNFTPPELTQIIRNSCNKKWSSSEEDLVKELKEPQIDFQWGWGYFDWAFQGFLGMCRVGVILYMNRQHLISLKLYIRCWYIILCTNKDSRSLLQKWL